LDKRVISIHAPLRGATQINNKNGMIYCYISIHAPLRGATDTAAEIENDTKISIHAPLRGATRAEMVLLGAG